MSWIINALRVNPNMLVYLHIYIYDILLSSKSSRGYVVLLYYIRCKHVINFVDFSYQRLSEGHNL